MLKVIYLSHIVWCLLNIWTIFVLGVNTLGAKNHSIWVNSELKEIPIVWTESRLRTLGAELLEPFVKGLDYEEVTEWPIQPTSVVGTPAGPWNFGQVVAVAVKRDGHILVLHRGGHPIMEFDRVGTFQNSWGSDLISEGKVVRIKSSDRVMGGSGYSAVYGPAGCYSCGAHSVRVDPEGNIWIVDAGGHVVYKMNEQGNMIMQLGTRGVSGKSTDHFNLPTDVGFASNGDVYVSDGYGNSRVIKFSREGKYLLHWGKRGTDRGEFGLPHNLVVDAQDRVYVTDRDNERIEIFDSDGNFLDQWEGVGGVSALFMTSDQHIWTGSVLRNLAGEVLEILPAGRDVHGIAANEPGDVFTAQLSGVVQKFIKR